ncbi:glycosyltransferase family 4 protein [Piscinibacter sakaiensis]|uniref:glycosyltransferase family 4 protein n=1 Tax=Piscinibacter sakaiensis TaxID=1547922 RepID=UPI003AB02B21
MSFDLACHLSSLGHEIVVICPQPTRPLGSKFELGDKLLECRQENGIKVVRVDSYCSPRRGLFGRIRESFSFGRAARKYLLSLAVPPKVLYVNAWPFFSQLMVLNYAVREKVRVVLQIMDVYPESLASKLPNPIANLCNLVFRRVDVKIARSADMVVVISEEMRRIYAQDRGVPDERLSVVFTWQDASVFDLVRSKTACCSRFGVPVSGFNFLFLGNIGPVANVDFLIRAFALAAIDGAQLIIVGDGSQKDAAIHLAQILNLSNVFFISDSRVENVPFLQGMADVCLLSMKQGFGRSSVPSKLASYMLSAKPILASVDIDCDTAEFIRTARCGWLVDADDLDALACKMIEVAAIPSECLSRIGGRGRDFAVTNFSKASGVSRLGEIIREVSDKQ